MKLMMLAAAVATPVIAQTMPAPTPPETATPAPLAPPADPAIAAPAADPAMAAAPAPASGPYPMCSRTVKDHCQERSNARGERLHTTPRG